MQFIVIVFCLFVIFKYFPFWFYERILPFDCSSSCALLFFYFHPNGKDGKSIRYKWVNIMFYCIFQVITEWSASGSPSLIELISEGLQYTNVPL